MVIALTIHQIYNAIKSVLPDAILHIINFSNDYLSNQADFTNNKNKNLILSMIVLKRFAASLNWRQGVAP